MTAINDIITSELLKTSKYYDSIGDDGRSTAYKRAVDSIEQYGKKITSGDQAKQLKWIGDGIAAKIDSILEDNGHRVDTTVKTRKSSPPSKQTIRQGSSRTKLQVIKQDIDDYDERGGGSSKVAVTLIDNIRNNAVAQQQQQQRERTSGPGEPKNNQQTKDLNRSSRTLRVKQYEFAPKPALDASVVSRAELDQFVSCVRRAWDKIIQKESFQGNKYHGTVECCGSFRRQQSRCHECVVLLKSNISYQRQKALFQDLIKILEKIRLLDANHRISYDSDYYQGILDVSKMFKSTRTGDHPDKQTNVPVVFRLVEQDSWPCALLRWTGPISYWTKLQSAAMYKGYELTERGLYLSNKQSGIGKRLYHRDEYDVVADIDMEYLDPVYRK
jgi:DNA polymerase/3'-5' exonuclease PolX